MNNMYKSQETKGVMSSGEQIGKPIFICEMEYYSVIKKKNLLIHTTWVDHKDNTEWKKLFSEGYILYVWFHRYPEENHSDGEQISAC